MLLITYSYAKCFQYGFLFARFLLVCLLLSFLFLEALIFGGVKIVHFVSHTHLTPPELLLSSKHCVSWTTLWETLL